MSGESGTKISKILTILLAPWGNPFTWGRASYRIRAGEEISVESTTSLIPLIKKFNPDLVFVMIPETLSCSSSQYPKDFSGQPMTILDVLGGDNLPRGYEKLMKNLSETVMSYIKRAMEDLETPVKVDIAPNTGTYGCSKDGPFVEWRFPDIPSVSPDGAYFSYFLVSALYHVRSMLNGAEYGQIEIILDTTHGINYATAAAIEATTLAARIISMVTGARVVLRQFNSTPYPRGKGDDHPPQLDIYLVREETIVPVKAAQRLVYSYCAIKDLSDMILGNPLKVKDLLKESHLEGDFKTVYRVAAPLVASVHYSLPLAFLQFSHDANEGMEKEPEKFKIHNLDSFLYNLLKSILSQVVAPSDKVVKHELVPDRRKVKGLLSAFAFALYGKRALQNLTLNVAYRAEDDPTSPPRDRTPARRRGLVEASIMDLETILERCLRGPMIFVARHELSQIKISLENVKRGSKDGGSKFWNELIEKARDNIGLWVSIGDCEQINPRNFIAHVGISPNLVEVKMVNENPKNHKVNLLLRYRSECEEKVRKTAGGDPIREIRELILISHNISTTQN